MFVMSIHSLSSFDSLKSFTTETAPEAMRISLAEDGAFIVKGLFSRSEIYTVRSVVFGALRRAGWIYDATEEAPRANMSLRCSDPSPPYLDVYDDVIALPEIHKLPHNRSVRVLAEKLGIAELFLLPRLAVRMIFPGTPPTPVHRDWTTVKGSRNAITIWVPLNPCDFKTGPIAVMCGSHLSSEVAQPNCSGRWSTAHCQIGDAIVFGSLTIHGALPNRSQSLRVSIDFRLQAPSEPLHPGSLLPPGRFRTWDDVYERWCDDDRRYACYWRDDHPVFQPSIADVSRSLENATGAEKRYLERIVKQVSQFSPDI